MAASGAKVEIRVTNVPDEHQNYEKMKEVFEEFGPIYNIHISKKGIVFISYTCEESASDAIEEMDGHKWNLNTIRVQYTTSNFPLGSLRIPSVSDDWNELKLSRHFSQYGKIANTHLTKSKDNRGRGNVAWVDFENPDDAFGALRREQQKQSERTNAEELLFPELIHSFPKYNPSLIPKKKKISKSSHKSKSSHRNSAREFSADDNCGSWVNFGSCTTGIVNCTYAHNRHLKGKPGGLATAPIPEQCRYHPNCKNRRYGKCQYLHKDQKSKRPIYDEEKHADYAKPKKSTHKKPAPKPRKKVAATVDQDPERTIFVKNLNFSTTEEELQSLFSAFGFSVDSCRIVRRRGQSVGYGFVEFSTKDDAQMLLDQGEIEFGGRKLTIEPKK